MARIKVIDKSHVNGWRRRWMQLSSGRFLNDYEVAKLAAEIRAEFPSDASGELQFTQFVRKNLRGTNGLVMGRKALAFGLFKEAEWRNLGGWAGISFLTALKRSERDRVIADLPARGPHHYSTIRARALKLGIVSRQKGRDTRSQAEDRVQRLRAWILGLYSNKKIRALLPPLTKEVESALTQKTLASLAGKANALVGRAAA